MDRWIDHYIIFGWENSKLITWTQGLENTGCSLDATSYLGPISYGDSEKVENQVYSNFMLHKLT